MAYGPRRFSPRVGRRKAERAAQGDEGRHTEGESGQLQGKPDGDPPVQVCTVGPEQDAAERAAEGQQPVARPLAHGAGRPPDEKGHHDPQLLGKEQPTDQRMRQEVVLQSGAGEEDRAKCTDEIGTEAQKSRRRRGDGGAAVLGSFGVDRRSAGCLGGDGRAFRTGAAPRIGPRHRGDGVIGAVGRPWIASGYRRWPRAPPGLPPTPTGRSTTGGARRGRRYSGGRHRARR
jgi:hypothetical protein